MENKYHGNWAAPNYDKRQGRDAVISEFFPSYGAAVPEDFPTEEEILYATYETPCYDGAALVIFARDGKLFEVNGSHCSCYGLEGQWTPEETSWGALAMRKSDYSMNDDAVFAYRKLVEANLQETN